MKHILITILLITQAHSMAPKIPGPASADTGSLIWVPNLTEKKQEKTNWCWSASTRMLLSDKTKPLPSQCEIVGKVIKEECCKKDSIKCNQPQHFHTFAGIYKLNVDNTPTFAEAVALIKKGKAVAISHSTSAGTAYNTGHSEVAYGTYKVKGKEYLVVYDPLTGNKKYMDASYVTGNLAWHQLVSVKDPVVKVKGSK